MMKDGASAVNTSYTFRCNDGLLAHLGCCLLTGLLAAACASSPFHEPPAIPELTDQPRHEIPDVDLLAMTPEMEEFVARHSGRGSRWQNGTWTLAYAAMDPYLLDFDYDPHVTLPADQAFERGVGNCLSFSSMFVAMARKAGMKAYFQEVEIPPTWSNVEDNLLVSKHVNAVVYSEGHTFTVDVSRRKTREVEQTRRLSDAEARAQYYNNLGADALIAQDIGLAYAYFSKALEADRNLSYIWSNIGVILRRNGQTEDAMLAYQTALRLEPDESVALNNLHVIYTEDGNLEATAELEARVERNRRKNPYYIQYLAELAIEEQRYGEAIDLAKKAIRMDADEYRFYYTLAQAQYLDGKTSLAQASLNQAVQRAPDYEARSKLFLPPEEF
jgi:tetratricopeptide (TPR) repeat protein